MLKTRETILHSDQQPDGKTILVKITTGFGRGKRIVQLIQTDGKRTAQVSMDNSEFRSLVAFASRKKDHRVKQMLAAREKKKKALTKC